MTTRLPTLILVNRQRMKRRVVTKIQKIQQVKVKAIKARMRKTKPKVHPAVLLVAFHQAPLGQGPALAVEGRLYFDNPVLIVFIQSQLYVSPPHTVINGYIFHGKLHFFRGYHSAKMKYSIKNFIVNMNKYSVNCGFVHIY